MLQMGLPGRSQVCIGSMNVGVAARPSVVAGSRKVRHLRRTAGTGRTPEPLKRMKRRERVLVLVGLMCPLRAEDSMLLHSRETDLVSPARLALQTVLAELPPELPLGILRALRVTLTQRLQLFNLNDLDSAAVRLTFLRTEATTIAGGRCP